MKLNKRAFAVISLLFAGTLLSPVVAAETPNAREADLASLIFAAAQPAKQECKNTCRARHRSCLSLKQIPTPECWGVYQDCIRFTCSAVKG